jgi:hypothetical protein
MGEDLRFAGEAAEGPGVDDAGTIALEGGAVGVRGLGVLALGERVVWMGRDGAWGERVIHAGIRV